MLEANSEALENSGGGGASVAAVNPRNEEGSGGGSVPGEVGEEERAMGEEGGDRSVTGNRWPREETLALLKIRSDMDIAFRDSTVKAPLWDEVSRKLAELGYHRSAKKCKEKFENIYKYHKRTKDSRSDRPKSKSYRFFEQLELLDNHSSLPSPSYNKVQVTTSTTVAMATATTAATMIKQPTSVYQVMETHSIQDLPMSVASTPSTSSSGREDSGGRKRKLVEYFERLTKEVLEKQESLQNKFIEAMERCERDRIAREEAWKMQELDRMKKQQEMVAQERAIAAAKDEAVIAFLRKISGQVSPVKLPEINPILPMKRVETQENGGGGGGGGGETAFPASSSRWPKAEVEALIRLRTNLDVQYQENGPKGPLWEEISSAMKKHGYDRSAKRCKEKWENINKYFKRTRDSNKKRPIDSKTCPYFHMLESLYEQKSKRVDSVDNPNHSLKPEHILMQMMVQQEQQQQQGPDQTVAEDGGSEHLDQDQDGVDDDDDDDGDDDEDDNGDDYQVVANNPSSVTTMESMD